MIRKTPAQILAKKKKGEKIVMLTAYDYPLAHFIDQCGIDIILVGDSLANVVLGLDSTRKVNMDIMLHHTKAVNRAVNNAMLVGDMPFGSYENDSKMAIKNARRFVEEAGCSAIKLEWFEGCLKVAQAIVKAGIPVMGHVGLTPQRADELGGMKVQGKDAKAAKKIIEQSKGLQEIGCFSIVLECIPDKVAEQITKILKIPTIGIGAGLYCDGQVLVTHDLLGLFDRYQPKFVKRYAEAGQLVEKGVRRFQKEVKEGKFPDREHSFVMEEREWKKLDES